MSSERPGSRIAVLAAILALLSPAALFAQALHTEFRLPERVDCEPTLSSLAGAEDGSFLAAWSLYCPRSGSFDAIARAFRANATPASGDLRLNQFRAGLQLSPSVASLANGGFVATWTSRPRRLDDPAQDGSGGGIFARLLDHRGVAQGDEFRVNSTTTGNQLHPVAASHAQGFSILWASGLDNVPLATSPALYLQRFDGKASPQGGEKLAMTLPTLLTEPRSYDLAHARGGAFAIAFSGTSPAGIDVGIRLFAADGTALSAGAKVNLETEPELPPEPTITALLDGRYVVVWRHHGSVMARIYGATGLAEGPPRELIRKRPGLFAHQVTTDHHGGFTLAWTEIRVQASSRTGSALFTQRFDASARPREPQLRIDRLPDFSPESPQLFEQDQGDLITAWTSISEPVDHDSSPGSEHATSSRMVSGVYLFARKVERACETADILCLRNDRFSVEVIWRDPYSRRSGVGRSTALTSDSGAFWFFTPDRLELSVKVLDGREINGHFWLFYASLTNVEFDLVVTDRQSGAVVKYHNPPFHFSSHGDTHAFREAAPDKGTGSPILFAPDLKERRIERERRQFLDPSTTESSLTLQERFTARVSWEDPYHRRSGEGQAVPITRTTGAFWFFAPNNLELLVKIIDGRAINGKYWLFYASLTNARFTLTVTDNLTGESRRYENPALEFASQADIEAF